MLLALFDCTEVSIKYEIKEQGFHVTKPIMNYFMAEISNTVDDSRMILAAQERCCDYICYLFAQLQKKVVKCVC